jgi:hypothetical protein
MDEILNRLRRLPPPLVDGRWTHCDVSVVDGRIRFREPARLGAKRRRQGLRRRLWLAAGATAGGGLAALFKGPAAGVAGLVGSLLGLAALDGLADDLRQAERPHEYAVIDARHQEVRLRAPNGWVVAAPLSEVRGFLMVIDSHHRRCHLGVVLGDGSYLPWLTTTAPQACNALTWVFGHLTERPALRLFSRLPLAPDWPAHVQEIEPPEPPDSER